MVVVEAAEPPQVDFDTLVFDTSVGDISPLECYFNRSVLNCGLSLVLSCPFVKKRPEIIKSLLNDLKSPVKLLKTKLDEMS